MSRLGTGQTEADRSPTEERRRVRPASQAPTPRHDRIRRPAIVVGATLLVVAVALALGSIGDGDSDLPRVMGPLVSAVTGTTDSLTPGEEASGPAVLPAEGRLEPSSDDWETLLPRLQQLAGADPGDINVQRKLALAYYNLGRFDEALAIYEQLLRSEEDAVLRNRVGSTLRDMGDLKGAENAYRQAIVDDPALGAAYLNLAEILWRQARDDEALAVLQEGLDAVPEDKRAPLEAGREILQSSS